MSWKSEFKRAFIDVVVSEGLPLRDGNTAWGYLARDWESKRERVATIGINYDASTWEESRWWDGADTFNDGYEKIGIDASIVLIDGEVIKFRYDGTASDLIIAIVK